MVIEIKSINSWKEFYFDYLFEPIFSIILTSNCPLITQVLLFYVMCQQNHFDHFFYYFIGPKEMNKSD